MIKIRSKYSLAFLLDIIFTITALLSIYYTRIQTKLYMDEITSLSPILNQFTQQASTNNITDIPLQEVIRLESLLDNALLINNVILPIIILILFITTQALVWKLINNTPIKKFILFSIIPAAIALLTINNFTDLIFNIMSGEDHSIILFIILIILSILLSYTSLILTTNYEKPKEILKTLKKKYKKSILPFILLIITTLFYLITFTIVLISAIAEYLSIITITILMLSIILFELTRYYFIKKVKSTQI
jgi:hypothetical protein